MWWLSLIGGLGTIAYVALAILAPSVLNILTPWFGILADLVKKVLAVLWEGVLYLTKSVPACILCLCLVFGYGTYVKNHSKKVFVEQIHKDYKFVPKKKQKAPIAQRIFTNPLDWWK